MVESAADLSQAEWQNLQTQANTLRDQPQVALDYQAVQSVLDASKPQGATVQASVGRTPRSAPLAHNHNRRMTAARFVCATIPTCLDGPRSISCLSLVVEYNMRLLDDPGPVGRLAETSPQGRFNVDWKDPASRRMTWCSGRSTSTLRSIPYRVPTRRCP